MLRLKNKHNIYFYIFIFIFLSTVTNNNLLKGLKDKFLIDEIHIEDNLNDMNKIILLNTNFLLKKNILFLNEEKLRKKLNNLNFLENIQIKKNYPSKLKIVAQKTNLIAITYRNQEKYYVGSNKRFIPTDEISTNKKLPFIFGKFNISDFLSLKKKLINKKIDYDNIDKYYFHKNKRWDLYFSNNVLIKLPTEKIDSAINLYNQFKISNQIKPNTIIDLRIPNRLIIKNE